MKSLPTPKTWRDYALWPVRKLIASLAMLEGMFYAVRDLLWNYPDYLFFGDGSLRAWLVNLYRYLHPISYIVSAILVVAVVFSGLYSLTSGELNAESQQNLIEGVVMGINEDGGPQQLTKINPIVPSNIQLEKDISELVYEPLFRYNADGEIDNVLVTDVIRRQEGAEYIFELKQDVYWHDGIRFRVEDVIATFDLISDLAADEELSQNAYIQAISQMGWEKTGAYSLALCTLTEQNLEKFRAGELERPCTGTRSQKPILSNFLELIAVKIMPRHLIGDLNINNINRPTVRINTFPVGTGPYQFSQGQPDEIILTKNEKYHAQRPSIDTLKLRLFATEDRAMEALARAEIHSLATASTINLAEVREYPQIDVYLSSILVNQYWSMYFNLKLTPDGEPVGPKFFQDRDVRKAITAAINKEDIIEQLQSVGEVTNGPINRLSEFYNPQAGWVTYDPDNAAQLLSKAGWELNDAGVREKDGEEMSFTLTYVDNYDRELTVQSIVDDLGQVGIKVDPQPRSPREIVNQVVSSKSFDALLYGMRTFIDPDRFELFHSQETGLSNLSSFVGAVETVDIVDGETRRIPKIDRLLEVGRSLNPSEAKEERKEAYAEFQELLSDDPPAVFLYNPKFIYYTQNDLNNIDLTPAGAIEERFLTIADWEL